jgi:DNA-binding response OmpR family regulator
MTPELVQGLILVVEDDTEIADSIRKHLTSAGFGVHVVHDGIAALKAVTDLKPAAIVLDVEIPGLDGIEITQKLRRAGNWTAILHCTASEAEVDRVLELETGADDYIRKPFTARELIARVRIAVRRDQRAGLVENDFVSLNEVLVDRGSRIVTVAGVEVSFTVTEYELLLYLMLRPGRVISREQLLSEVWGYATYVSGRTVDTHIAQVRAKLGEHSFIRTFRGVGYSAEEKKSVAN